MGAVAFVADGNFVIVVGDARLVFEESTIAPALRISSKNWSSSVAGFVGFGLAAGCVGRGVVGFWAFIVAVVFVLVAFLVAIFCACASVVNVAFVFVAADGRLFVDVVLVVAFVCVLVGGALNFESLLFLQTDIFSKAETSMPSL